MVWGGGGVMVHVSGGRRGLVWGSREGRGDLSSGLSQPGEKANEQSGRACSDASGTVFLMVGAEETVGGMGGVLHDTGSFTGAIVQGKCLGWRGEGHL